MIDLEDAIYDTVAAGLRTAHPGVYVAAEYADTPAKFPAVTILEADNRIYNRMRTDEIENAAAVMYEVNVYSDKPGTRKSEAKDIANTADDLFRQAGFTRTFREQVPNFKDSSIYRILCRYEAVIDSNNVIYYSE